MIFLHLILISRQYEISSYIMDHETGKPMPEIWVHFCHVSIETLFFVATTVANKLRIHKLQLPLSNWSTYLFSPYEYFIKMLKFETQVFTSTHNLSQPNFLDFNIFSDVYIIITSYNSQL